MAANGFQTPLFPAVPLLQGHLRHARQVWREAQAALTRTATRNKGLADRHQTPAPDYQPSERVWLSSLDLPLQTESQKLVTRYIGSYQIDR